MVYYRLYLPVIFFLINTPVFWEDIVYNVHFMSSDVYFSVEIDIAMVQEHEIPVHV